MALENSIVLNKSIIFLFGPHLLIYNSLRILQSIVRQFSEGKLRQKLSILADHSCKTMDILNERYEHHVARCMKKIEKSNRLHIRKRDA